MRANNTKKKQQGFSLLEVVVALSLCILIAYGTGSIYLQTVQVHRRQQRIMSIERSLLNTHHSLRQSLTTFPARNLGVTIKNFSIPTLPTLGNILNPETNKVEPINLGIITPCKLADGGDAFMVIYSDAKLPRLPLAQDSSVEGDFGSARVPLPINATVGYTPPSGGGGGVKLESGSSPSFITKGTPTPNPSPEPTSSPSPEPQPTKLPGGGIDTTPAAVPPNIPTTETLTGLPYYANTSFYKSGDVMLLVGTLPSVGRKFNLSSSGQVQAVSRLVKLTQISQPSTLTIGVLNQKYIDFTYDLCLTGECDNETLPGLSNTSTTPTRFRAGSILMPIKIVTFYVKKTTAGNRLIRNDGGAISPIGDGNFRVVGGIEHVLGEADSMTVNYVLDDESVKNTPTSPNVSWLNQIKAVDIALVKGMPQVQGSEDLTRKINLNFPLVIRHFE